MEDSPTSEQPPGSLEDAMGQSADDEVLDASPQEVTVADNGPEIDEYQSNGGENEEPLAAMDLSWQASEYIHHQKRPVWYMALFVAVAGLLVAGILTHQWSGIVVLAAMTAAVLVYANKAPRTLSYSLTDEGVTIEAKFHPYSQFKSFAVISDVAWHTIDLDPIKRFAPRLTILFEDKDLNDIVEALSNQLPRVYRQPDLVERLTRFLKF